MADSPKIIVFDTLTFNLGAFHRLAANFKTASISPEFNCMESVGAIFHRTAYEPREWREFSEATVIYKGLDYWISGSIVTHFPQYHPDQYTNEPKLNIGISMGGIDARNETLRVLDALAGLTEPAVLWVALGEGYSHSLEEIFESADRNYHEVVIIKSNESMWRVLQNVSVLICAGGVTAYESWQAGIPSLIISRRPDWAYLVQELEDFGVAKIIPAPSGVDPLVASRIVGFFDSRETLATMRNSCAETRLLDGAQHVAEIIHGQLTLQKVWTSFGP